MCIRDSIGLKGAELRHRVEELLTARNPTYGQAHMRVRANGDPHTIVERIRQGLEGAEGRPAQER